jgi:hypothetical protein
LTHHRWRLQRVTCRWIASMALGVLALLSADQLAAERTSIVYPPRLDTLVFSHARHLPRVGSCAACHPASGSSRSAVDLLAPTEAECRACHPVDRMAPSATACGKCHRGFFVGAPVARVQAAPAALKFSHAAHGRFECQHCHASAAAGRSGDNDPPALPSMASCLSCHRDGTEARRCTECHLATRGGLIDTTLGGTQEVKGNASGKLGGSGLRPSSNLFGDAHGPGFASDHRAASTRTDRTCGACHDESYCADCHAGSMRPMEFHPDAYLQVHAVAARRATSECSTCHRYQTFCVGCHERVGVGTRAASEWTSGQGPSSFHPAGWASASSSGGPNLHAREARRNLPTCASCHREGDCLSCHSADAGGLRITPHPPGWRGSSRCRALDRGNRRMCLRCHVAVEEIGCDWTARP